MGSPPAGSPCVTYVPAKHSHWNSPQNKKWTDCQTLCTICPCAIMGQEDVSAEMKTEIKTVFVLTHSVSLITRWKRCWRCQPMRARRLTNEGRRSQRSWTHQRQYGGRCTRTSRCSGWPIYVWSISAELQPLSPPPRLILGEIILACVPGSWLVLLAALAPSPTRQLLSGDWFVWQTTWATNQNVFDQGMEIWNPSFVNY